MSLQPFKLKPLRIFQSKSRRYFTKIIKLQQSTIFYLITSEQIGMEMKKKKETRALRGSFKARVYDFKDCSLLISSFRCCLWLYSIILTI